MRRTVRAERMGFMIRIDTLITCKCECGAMTAALGHNTGAARHHLESVLGWQIEVVPPLGRKAICPACIRKRREAEAAEGGLPILD